MAGEKESAQDPVPLFGDRLDRTVRERKSVVAAGIDPTLAMLPPDLAELARSGPDGLHSALSDFCLGVVMAVGDLVAAVKPNIAFFEAFGLYGLTVYKSVCLAAADLGLLVIGDVKRGDIGSTAAAYASGLLDCPRPGIRRLAAIGDAGQFAREAGPLLGPHDALTLNPYLGSDSVKPFLEKGCDQGQGFFILVKTSNPSGADLQDLRLDSGETVAERVAALTRDWGGAWIGESGLSSVGAVVGATHPSELCRCREIMPSAPFLVPGYGAQGGTAADVVPAFRPDGSGAVISASRSILQAWKTENNPLDWQGAARRAAGAMNADLRSALRAAGKGEWL
ncbi:MAG: orotidine-5'-phosphate decarboxylase [Planctomycetota bacterium]|jgi:orotidine-5'-phosphate decarboxylase|nr:orotidine-5'-phosphate decarboxylase [Planctomycetota bacterium]